MTDSVTRLRTLALALTLAAGAALVGCGTADDGAAPVSPVTVTETVTETPSESPSASASPSITVSPSEGATLEQSASASVVPPSQSDEPVDLSQPPQTYEEAEAHVAAATGGRQELKRFESPDGQFYCVFANRFVPPSCEVLDGVRDPAACDGSPSQEVGRIELTAGGWTAFCNTDTVRMPGASKLAVGAVATWSAEGLECVLEEPGVTCLRTSDRQGFFFGSGRYEIF